MLRMDGAIFTGDAIFCRRAESAPPARREICRTITDSGGDYAFVVVASETRLRHDDNQHKLKAAIAESLGELSPLRDATARPRRAAG